MNAPIPLRPDVNALRESAMRSLTRAAIDTARRVHDRHAKGAWPDDLVAKLITKGAVTQTTIADTQAFQSVALAFVTSLTPVSAAAQIIARSLQLTFNGAAQISVPSLTLPNAAWLAEGAAIPVVEGTTSLSTMINPYKLGVITTLNNEMLRNTSNAQAMVRQTLLENVGPTLDHALLSADAAVPGVKPAGILNGIAPLAPRERQARECEYLEEMGQLPERREWKLPEPEPPPRERGLDTSPVNWSSVIDQRIADARGYLLEVITETVAELAERQRDAIDDAMRPLRAELCELKISNAELRVANAALREQLSAGDDSTIDLPALPLRGRAN